MILSAQRVALTCHPDTPTAAVRCIEVVVQRVSEANLDLTFSLQGTIAALRVPPARPPRRVDRLWEHTCFEAFIKSNGRPAYYEFNLAPSGEWAASAFRRYREREPLADKELAPRITVRSGHDQLDLDAVIRVDRLFTMKMQAQLQLGLSAVIEEEPGTLTYWALRHAPGKPDFHHPDGFALQLTSPAPDAPLSPR